MQKNQYQLYPSQKNRNRPLWKQVPTNTSPTYGNICEEQCEKSNKPKTSTISNFLKEMHVEAQNQSDSQILSVFDLKYCESDISRRQGQKQMAFMIKLLMVSLRDVYEESRSMLEKFQKWHTEHLAVILNKFSELQKKTDEDMRQKKFRIKQLELSLKQAKIKANELEKNRIQTIRNSSEFQQLNKQNKQLRDYLKQINVLMMNLHDKNNVLEAKLEQSKIQYEKKSNREIEKIREKYEKMTNQIRENFQDKVSEKVLKYISKYEAIRDEEQQSFCKNSTDTIIKVRQCGPSPKSSTKRFERTAKNLITPTNIDGDTVSQSYTYLTSNRSRKKSMLLQPPQSNPMQLSYDQCNIGKIKSVDGKNWQKIQGIDTISEKMMEKSVECDKKSKFFPSHNKNTFKIK